MSQQRVAVNSFPTALTSLAEQRSTALNALAVLLGLTPQSLQAPQADLGALKIPRVNLTPPATLLSPRPDIESRAPKPSYLRAANADIGTAPALFFPSLTLGTDTSVAAGFGNPAASAVSLAANVLAPIFTGGKLAGISGQSGLYHGSTD